MLRRPILAAADSAPVRGFVDRYGMRLGAQRFVAGETLDQAVAVLRRLNEQGLRTNTTLLGEHVRDRDEAEQVTATYEEVLRRIDAEQLADEPLREADPARRGDRPRARLREHRAPGRRGRPARELRPDRHGGHAVHRPHARDLPPPARGGARQRRHRPPGATSTGRPTTSSRCSRWSRTCASSRARTRSPRTWRIRRRPMSTPRTTGSLPARSRRAGSRPSRRTTRRASTTPFRSAPARTGWSCRCSSAYGRSSSSTSSAAATASSSPRPTGPTGTRT